MKKSLSVSLQVLLSLAVLSNGASSFHVGQATKSVRKPPALQLFPVLFAEKPRDQTGELQLPFETKSLDKKFRPGTQPSSLGSSTPPLSGPVAVLADTFQSVTEPAQRALDGLTGGWALSYADLSPESPGTTAGKAFLLTNAAYLGAGVLVAGAGDYWLGFWTDVAAVASFNYHYNQLVSGGETAADSVRMALLLDYTAAAVSLLTAAYYLLDGVVLSGGAIPMEALGFSAASLVFLGMSWIWEYGRPYMLWHSLWHLCSGYAGYLIGIYHSS